MKCLKLLAAAACLIASSSAFAQLYLFAGAGGGNPKFDDQDFPGGALSGIDRRNDTKDSTFQGGIGYRLSPHWAVEVGAADLGDYSIDIADSFGNAIFGTYKVKGVKSALLGGWPLTEKWWLFGKLGISSTKAEFQGTSVSGGASAPINADERRNSLLAGFGLQWMVWRNLGVRAEYENWGEVGNEGLLLLDNRHTGKAKMSTWNLQAVFSF
jgi:opacity protein-like surface antigen